MDQNKTIELSPEAACSVFIPKISESKKIIQEINGLPTYADKIKTLSMSNRIFEGASRK